MNAGLTGKDDAHAPQPEKRTFLSGSFNRRRLNDQNDDKAVRSPPLNLIAIDNELFLHYLDGVKNYLSPPKLASHY